MKVLLIGNQMYFPYTNNKYIGGSVSGHLFPDQIYTLKEIQDKHAGSSMRLQEVDGLLRLNEAYNS